MNEPDWYWLNDLEQADPEYLDWLDRMDARKQENDSEQIESN